MFQTMGHENVFVLDGGLPEWSKQNYPVSTTHKVSQNIGNFQGIKNSEVIKDFHFMKTYAPICTVQVIDARSKGRFDGTAPEPREGLKSGSIPYSINIPFQEVLADGKLKSKDELNDIFEIVKDNDRPKVFTCGSGLTACIILLAAKHIGINDLSIYDGSWTEWATKTQNLKN
jgi:thiosulfate/3-mercaptopyruvate sulfurtransferase